MRQERQGLHTHPASATMPTAPVLNSHRRQIDSGLVGVQADAPLILCAVPVEAQATVVLW